MADSPAFVFIYSTFPDEAQATPVARFLVEQRLAACVNIIAGMRSVYRWEGRIEESSEVVFLAKTRAEGADAVMAAIAQHHPYEVPAVVVLPLAAASAAYGRWILAETEADQPGTLLSSGSTQSATGS